MIELIKIKLASGVEVELTMEDARQLFDELHQLFGERQSISTAPFQIQMPEFMNPPFKITANPDYEVFLRDD